MSDNKQRTYTVKLDNSTFENLKNLERATGMPRDVLVTAIVETVINPELGLLERVMRKALQVQSSAIEARLTNGGFDFEFNTILDGKKSSPQPNKSTTTASKSSGDKS